MLPLAAQGFGYLVRARTRAYERGWLGVARLGAPVASIGNLRVGGSGKTPAVIALGQELQRHGLKVDVLSRGYRRAHRGLAVAETGAEAVALVGDEPKLIAQRLRAPVLVHPDRYRAGLEGERRFGTQLHLLDDGFQHRQLHRQFDLVLIAPEDLEERLLPAGRLREPPSALARAQAILWLGDDGALAAARARLERLTPAPIYLARKRAPPPPPSLASKPFAFCALARPESFWATLAGLGISPVGRRAFRDHHHYSARDLRHLRQQAQAAGANGFVTTAKDAVKLGDGLEGLSVVEITMDIPAIESLAAQIREVCGL